MTIAEARAAYREAVTELVSLQAKAGEAQAVADAAFDAVEACQLELEAARADLIELAVEDA